VDVISFKWLRIVSDDENTESVSSATRAFVCFVRKITQSER
jgi:hypothetical protein